MRPLHLLLCGFAAAAGSACSLSMPLPAGARDTFVRDQTCPAERITVVARPDLPPHAILSTPKAPSSSVTADPERLALWRRQQAEHDAAFDEDTATFEVKGCGQRAVYACWHPTKYSLTSGRYVGDPSTVRNGLTIISAVRCLEGRAQPAP